MDAVIAKSCNDTLQDVLTPVDAFLWQAIQVIHVGGRLYVGPKRYVAHLRATSHWLADAASMHVDDGARCKHAGMSGDEGAQAKCEGWSNAVMTGISTARKSTNERTAGSSPVRKGMSAEMRASAADQSGNNC